MENSSSPSKKVVSQKAQLSGFSKQLKTLKSTLAPQKQTTSSSQTLSHFFGGQDEEEQSEGLKGNSQKEAEGKPPQSTKNGTKKGFFY